MRFLLGCVSQAAQTCRLDLLYLITDKAQASHIAPQLVERIWRYGCTLGCAHLCELVRRLAYSSGNPVIGEILLTRSRAILRMILIIPHRSQREPLRAFC
jgi:hypothetical protein